MTEELAQTYRDTGRLNRAVPLLEDIAGRGKAKLGADHIETIVWANHLVSAYLDARRWTEAEGMARECVDICTRTRPDDWLRYHSMSHLGAAMAGREKYAEAEPLLIGDYEGMKAREAKIPARSRRFLTSAASRIVPFYEAWGKADKAAEWRTKLGQPAPARPKSSRRPPDSSVNFPARPSPLLALPVGARPTARPPASPPAGLGSVTRGELPKGIRRKPEVSGAGMAHWR